MMHYASLHSADFLFLSEPQMFKADLIQISEYFQGEYCCYLNSDDAHDRELALNNRKAKGGTMIMWKKVLDPYVTVDISAATSSFIPIIFKYPGHSISIHYAIYLPTSGQESEFMDALALLANSIENLRAKYPEAIIFIRGDANVNPKHQNRVCLLE